MADPLAMLEQHARRLYNKHRKGKEHRYYPLPTWTKAPNHVREDWREKAQRSLCSKETLADELRREERERAKLSVQRAKGE